jgi:hypothetical protein
MSERNVEVIRTEISAERHGLEGDLDTLRGDVRRFAVRAAAVAVAAVTALIVTRVVVRMLRRS